MVHCPCLKYRHDAQTDVFFSFFFFWFLKTVFYCVALGVLELCRSDWPLKRSACLFCLCMHYHHLVFYLLIMMFLLRSGLVEFCRPWTYFVAKGCFVSSASTLVLGTVVHCHICWRYYFSCLYCSSFCAVEASTVLMFFETGSLPSAASTRLSFWCGPDWLLRAWQS